MILRPTKIEDISRVIDIINQAKTYFKNNDIDQWQDGYPNEETIEKDIASKVPKKDTKIVLYCNTGNRSGQAFEKLKKLGYTNVSNAQGVKQYKYDLVK